MDNRLEKVATAVSGMIRSLSFDERDSIAGSNKLSCGRGWFSFNDRRFGKSFSIKRRRESIEEIIPEQKWFRLLDLALLVQSSYLSKNLKQESVGSRWSRAKTRAAKVGKGLSKDGNAQKLAPEHWREAIDPWHRYGHNLHLYYNKWRQCQSNQRFFYWLDVGDGKELNLEPCPRRKLQQQCIKYLAPEERENYEVRFEDGKLIYKHNDQFVDTSTGDMESKWIFVLSTSKVLYVGQKRKGRFQHSSFLAGAAASSAGRLVVEQGVLKVRRRRKKNIFWIIIEQKMTFLLLFLLPYRQYRHTAAIIDRLKKISKNS